jgi:hypothetical protein
MADGMGMEAPSIFTTMYMCVGLQDAAGVRRVGQRPSIGLRNDRGGDMHYARYGLRRRTLPRTPLNRARAGAKLLSAMTGRAGKSVPAHVPSGDEPPHQPRGQEYHQHRREYPYAQGDGIGRHAVPGVANRQEQVFYHPANAKNGENHGQPVGFRVERALVAHGMGREWVKESGQHRWRSRTWRRSGSRLGSSWG